jgi:uncharacterized protein (TIGR03435 family)
MTSSAAIFAVLAVPALCAQGPVKFEVASVKVIQTLGSAPAGARYGNGGCRHTFRVDPGQLEIHCTFLPEVIGYAFGISPGHIAGPDWIRGPGAPVFDIVAKIPEGASQKQIPEMLRNLLADRWRLAAHIGTREASEVLALVIAKGGLKLQPAGDTGQEPPPEAAADEIPFGDVAIHSAPDGAGGVTRFLTSLRMGSVREKPGPDRLQRWEASSTTLRGLADLLDIVGPWQLPVVDMTEVPGRFQATLQVTLPRAGDPRDMEDDIVRAFNDGLRELGLRLERRRGSVGTLVVDRIEKTPIQN